MTASILNHVIGPIMPGSSSSHTAGPYHIAKLLRGFAGLPPERAVFTFAPGSSIAECYREQGSDLALMMGILGLPLTDPRFKEAAQLCSEEGIETTFELAPFAEAAHPNSIKISLELGFGGRVEAVADSTGGGAFVLRMLNGAAVDIRGDSYCLFVESEDDSPAEIMRRGGEISQSRAGGRCFTLLTSSRPASAEIIEKLRKLDSVRDIRRGEAVFHPLRGEPLFRSGGEMIAFAEKEGLSLGEAALEYESALLGISKEELNREMEERLRVMESSVALGLSDQSPQMFLLRPTAKKIMDAEAAGRLALGGIHTRAAARAMAAMQVNSGQGIVCAAPTGGSAGVLPGVLVTMLEDMKLPRERALRALWAAGAAGWVLAERGTFAAEVCGCQVEIGAAGAMAAAVADAAGGTARQSADAAAIMFQNAMGLVCDLVQSTVEIPCHTRNGSFASQAFICADMILGGYENPVGIDGTVDAVYATGKMMAHELRCTSLGGMATAPEALAMKRLR
ncbi:MAG: L-serine ammonia-lyase, iron-sulfur-dependent, subunit alpha [Synergistaceae bacterium]|nr:L-serine ammonia-lyase, iron-sulfur-dependent, subunit alpha [Synergistaceae bacterium]